MRRVTDRTTRFTSGTVAGATEKRRMPSPRRRSVYGRSDALGAHPVENAVSPADVTATVYHALGIPADLPIRDRQNRPHQVTDGHPIVPLFG